MHPPNSRAAVHLLVFGTVTVATPVIAMFLPPGSEWLYVLRGVTWTSGLSQVLVVLLLFLMPARPAREPGDSPTAMRRARRPLGELLSLTPSSPSGDAATSAKETLQ